MARNPNLVDPRNWVFNSTAFSQLMQRRIYRILVICSNYDFFMLEEDGRIDEQIYYEYFSLNLRYPPVFVKADSAAMAFDILRHDDIDMVIEMLNIRDLDPFELAHRIKAYYPRIPLVVLTPFSREVSIKLKNEDLSAVDQVFCWLGNADLLLAIIKSFEDRMNAEFDVSKVGVQTILLVEDSIRYISSFLPNIYRIVLEQSRSMMSEGLNEHNRSLRMRGRPKVLLANNYAEALSLYNKYKNSMLGIITDVSYKKDKQSGSEQQMGVEFARQVLSEDPFMPIILQSSDASNRRYAEELNVGFIHKLSKTLSIELRDYIMSYFAFGDFVFRDPVKLTEISRASDLQSFQEQLLTIPDRVFLYHTGRNDVSKWLNARALFAIAQMFKQIRTSDFDTLQEARQYIFDAISAYRFNKSRSTIAKFDYKNYNRFLVFSRIGEGSIGGKARGLAFIESLLDKYNLFNRFDNTLITIPRTVVLGTDVFDEFMEHNNLFEKALSDLNDNEILNCFLAAELPESLLVDLRAFIAVIRRPVAIRSSSRLEDSHYQPFAGIYSTVMLPLNPDPERMLDALCKAIKNVYASVFYKSSKAYMTATQNVIDEEKMGIILQEISGRAYENRFYPAISGVARSVNFYPIQPEKPEDGVATIAYGLGKYIVDGGLGLRFSPKYPKKALQLSSPESALRDTQKYFYALDLNPERWKPDVDESNNLMRLPIKQSEHDAAFKFAASTYDYASNMIKDGLWDEGKKVITFSRILNHNTFPLAEILSTLLHIAQNEMNNPVEIEFAADLDVPPDKQRIFNILQIRPIVLNDQTGNFDLSGVPPAETLISSKMALGNGLFSGIQDVLYVKPEHFNASHNAKIGEEVERFNEFMRERHRNYVLIGPGRWGSSDPWLGIPVKWPQISEARIIVESGLENYRIDPSQGTHFFQNLTSFRVGYMTVNPYINDGFYDVAFLNAQPSAFENEWIRHVRFEKALQIVIDGRSNSGVIYKPGAGLRNHPGNGGDNTNLDNGLYGGA